MAFSFRLNQDDLVQDVLLMAWRKRDQYNDEKGESGFMGWIWLIARNQAINIYRKNKKMGETSDIEIAENVVGMESPSNMDERQMLATIYRDLRREFPKRRFALVAYMRAQGYKMREIAVILDMELSTVRGTMFRVREYLETKNEYQLNSLDKY